MESGARPPLLTPHEPLSGSVSSGDPPVWEPIEQLPRPPPLPSPAHQPSGRALTAKQYKGLSLLPSVIQLGAQNAGPRPLLPVDLPSVKKLVAAGHASDSEGAVTSRKIEAKKLAAAAAAKTKAAKKGDPFARPADGPRSNKKAPEAEELTSLLEETLERELPVKQRQEEEVGEEEGGPEENEDEQGKGGELQLENIETALNNNQGTGSIKDRAIRAALKATGYESWEAFTAELSKNAAAAAAAAAAGGTSTRRKPRPKPAAVIKIDQVINSSSHVYHAAFKQAYYAAKNALEKKDTAKRKAQELEEYSSLIPRWSALSAADHTWYLKNEGQQLIGADAERYATLKAKFEAEKIEYWAAVEAEGRSHMARYKYIGARQGGQLEEDAKLKIKRVLETMPQFWKLRNVVNLVETDSGDVGLKAVGEKDEDRELFPFKQELFRHGEAPILVQLPPGTSLPGNKLYLPTQLCPEAGPRPGEAGAVYRKACSAALWDDPNIAIALQNTAQIFLEKEEEQQEKEEEGQPGDGLGMDSEVIVCATAGAMLCLLRSSFLNHSQSWHIPVVIHDGSTITTESDTTRYNIETDKIIYLGAPVCTEKETLRSKQQRLQKYAIITEGLTMQDSGTHKPKPSNAQPGPREAIYWLTTAGTQGEKIPLCIRSQGRVFLKPNPDQAKAEETVDEEDGVQPPLVSAVLSVSTEYLPEPDLEEERPEELATWWSKLTLTPGADTAAIAHVHVPSSRVVQWKFWSGKDTALECGGKKIEEIENTAKRTIDAVMKSLKVLEPGKYLLKHGAGENSVQIFEEEGNSEQAGEAEGLYDLHATQAIAGEIDTSIDPFIPPKWRPYREDIAQVPFTFPPELYSRGRGRGGGGRGVRKRQRRDNWRGDLDQVQHVATISRSEYAAQLLEEL